MTVAVSALWRDYVDTANERLAHVDDVSFDWYPRLFRELESYVTSPVLEAGIAAHVLARQKVASRGIPADQAMSRSEDFIGLLVSMLENYREAFGEPTTVQGARDSLQTLVSMMAIATAHFLHTISC